MSKAENLKDKTGNEIQNVDKIPQKSRTRTKTSKQTPKELMHRHVSDEKDIITDEDLKNLNLDTSIEGDVAHEPLEIVENPNHPKDESKDHRIKTPWDVLDE